MQLGDYIDEYGSDPKQYGNGSIPGNRITSLPHDIVTMNDHRTRHALYKSDLNLQAVHAKMPWITVSDDHEFANNIRGMATQPSVRRFSKRRKPRTKSLSCCQVTRAIAGSPT